MGSNKWLNPSTMLGSICAAVFGGVIGTLIIDGLRYLIG